MRTPPKPQRPGERLPYRVTIAGDALASAAWSSEPAGLRIEPPDGKNTSSTSDVFVSGVVPGVKYRLLCTLTGVAGGQFVREFWIQGVA